MSESTQNPHIDVGRHLGQTSSYKDRYDPSLLVPIPRKLNRDAIGLGSTLPFDGYDIWNAYEVSCLTDSGLPVATVLRFRYSASSPYLVESKSLKLYLNSFNQEVLGLNRDHALRKLMQTIKTDLQRLLYSSVDVILPDVIRPKPHPLQDFPILESMHPAAPATDYCANPGILRKREANAEAFTARSGLLRSRCRQTSQPDWGDVYIHLQGPNHPDTEKLLAYLVSFRQENHFHEEIVETIFSDLYSYIQPSQLLVMAQYTRRGGIDINPVRTTPGHALSSQVCDLKLFSPTDRQ